MARTVNGPKLFMWDGLFTYTDELTAYVWSRVCQVLRENNVVERESRRCSTLASYKKDNFVSAFQGHRVTLHSMVGISNIKTPSYSIRTPVPRIGPKKITLTIEISNSNYSVTQLSSRGAIRKKRERVTRLRSGGGATSEFDTLGFSPA